jgi:ankyrin repeat protein
MQSASEAGHVEVVKRLLHAGAVMDIEGDDDGINIPPLTAAIMRGQLEVVEILLDAGADWNIKGRWKPLSEARSCGDPEILWKLLDAKAASRANLNKT